MQENTIAPEPEETPVPEPVTPTEPEETPEPEEETPTEETPEEEESTEEAESAEATEPKTYGGVRPLDSIEDVLTFHEGDGEWQGSADLSDLQENAKEASIAAKTIVRANTTLSNAYRKLCTALLVFRAGVMIERNDGSIGPDWAGDSALSQRYTALTVGKPLAEAGYDTTKIRSVMNQVSVYMGRKVPGQNYTLRDQFIRDHYKEEANLTGEEYTPAQVDDRVDAESKSTGLKSARMATAERQANTAGPGTTRPVSPLPAISNAVRDLTNSTAPVSDAKLLIEVLRILTKVGRNVYVANGEWTDRPQAVQVLRQVDRLVDALVENIDHHQETWNPILDNLYGSEARKEAEADRAKVDAEAEAEEAEESTEPQAEEAEAV